MGTMKRYTSFFATLCLTLFVMASAHAQSVSIAAAMMQEDLEVIKPASETAETAAPAVQFNFPELDKPLPAIKYPVKAKQFKIQGRVLVEYTVNAKGRVEDIQILRGPGGGCKAEVRRILRAARFVPAVDADGNPVATRYLSGFDFRL